MTHYENNLSLQRSRPLRKAQTDTAVWTSRSTKRHWFCCAVFYNVDCPQYLRISYDEDDTSHGPCCSDKLHSSHGCNSLYRSNGRCRGNMTYSSSVETIRSPISTLYARSSYHSARQYMPTKSIASVETLTSNCVRLVHHFGIQAARHPVQLSKYTVPISTPIHLSVSCLFHLAPRPPSLLPFPALLLHPIRLHALNIRLHQRPHQTHHNPAPSSHIVRSDSLGYV